MEMSGSEDLNTDLYDLDISSISVGQIFLPSRSGTCSDYLALQLLALCCGHTAENTALLFESAGLEILQQVHYDKDPFDPSHTCAFTIGYGEVMQNLMFRKNALIVTIRGTQSGEWYSNFDCWPSFNSASAFSENFLYCAEDIFLTLKNYIDREEDPLVIICGHSRGAASANLLGVLVNEYIGSDHVFVYTFACPNTIQSEAALPVYDNIFNYINPCDLTPRLPFSKWGFTRAGTDIILDCSDGELEDQVEYYKDILFSVAPSIRSYYQDRHSLTDSGLSEEGLTSFETMLLLCDTLTELTVDEDPGTINIDDLLSDDLLSIDPDADNLFLSEDSDLWPLIEIGQDLTADDQRLGKEILHQHLPDIYLSLIRDRLFSDNN